MKGEPRWPLLGLAAALVACVVALVVSTGAPPPASGFDRAELTTAACVGDASPISVDREPFLSERARDLERCVRWTSHLMARTNMRARIEMAAEPGGTVIIDGRPVVTDHQQHPARVAIGTVDLARGVHTFVAEHPGAPNEASYFRVRLVDELAPHNFEFAPPLDDAQFFPNIEVAQKALVTPAPEPSMAPTLLACLALVLAGTFVWLDVRRRRDKSVPWADVGVAAAIFAAALVVRLHGLRNEDTTWDELTYVDTCACWIRNLALGDWNPTAWAFNLAHPPNTKVLLSLGVALGGVLGARVVSASLSALAAALLFAFGRVAFGRAVGAVAGALAVVLPLWVAHGRVVGHESVVLFWWCASMLALAVWLRGVGSAWSQPARGDKLAAFVCVFTAAMGVLARANVVWLVPLLALALVWVARKDIRRGVFPVPLAAVAGGLAAVALTVSLWPYLWLQTGDQLTQLAAMAESGKPRGDIEVYLGKLTLPAWHYFAFAFAAETPALLLAAAIVGVALALASSEERKWGVLCLAWLVFPFAQSVSTLRIGAGRYVIQSWPALLLFAAVALVAAGAYAVERASHLSARARTVLLAAPGALAVAYAAFALWQVEPYPLDYFDELVGGPAGVAAHRTFEVPWWGEGALAATRALNEIAPPGARVNLALWPVHTRPRLRDDLVLTDDAATADYVLLSHIQYFAKPPPGCTSIANVAAEGASLVETFHCTPAGLPQVGFSDMNHGATGDAIAHFQRALERDPNDAAALFGMGWAAQVQGRVHDAQGFYAQAAARASAANDLETEYFAHFDLGTLYAEQHDPAAAAKSFRDTLAVVIRAPARFADREWNVWMNLGRALATSGHPNEARAALARASVLRPGEPAIAEAYALLATLPAASASPSASAPRAPARPAPTSSAPLAAPLRR